MSSSPHHQRGVSFVLWLIALFPLLGFATLALDVNNIFLVRAQVQNAADAGALAGAAKLPDVTAAIAVAVVNKAQGESVESGTSDVTPGCWSFSTTGGSFTTTNCGTTANPYNAVEVITRRRDTPIQAFFGKAVGFEKYSAEAIARAYSSPAARPGTPNEYVVLCGPNAFVLKDSVLNQGVTTPCRKLKKCVGNDPCDGSQEGTIRRLNVSGNITIQLGTWLTLKPGEPQMGDLANLNGEELVPVVDTCPANTSQQVKKIVNARNIQRTGLDPCVIFPDAGTGGEPNNANGPARLVY